MAATSQTINYEALYATTMQAYRPTMEDNIFTANPLFYWLTQKGHKRTQDGGTNLLVPVMYGKNSTVRSYTGYDVLDTSPQDGMTVAIYPWRQIAGSTSVSRREERQNSGKSRAIALLEAKIDQTEKSLIEELDRMAFLDGTGNASQDIFGLALLVEDGAAWLSNVAGIDRTVETWWRNQFIGTVGSFATNGIDKMRTLYNLCSKGNIHPDLVLTTVTTFEDYEKKLAVNERFLDMETGDAGFQNLLFKGAIIMYDTYCQSGYLYMLTSDYIWWYVDSQTDFYSTPFIRPGNQDARTSQLLIMGNLAASNCARQGLMNGITSP